MIPFPISFDIAAAVRCVVVLFFAGIVIWFVVIVRRDARANLMREIDVAIAKTNEAIDQQLSIDEKIALVQERARSKALAQAQALPAIAPICPASDEQAAALTAIK